MKLSKKAVYDKLVTKLNNIDTSEFVLKTKYDTDESDLEKKIRDANKKSPAISEFVKKRNYNAKITGVDTYIENTQYQWFSYNYCIKCS